jgi:hypothetical protein
MIHIYTAVKIIQDSSFSSITRNKYFISIYSVASFLQPIYQDLNKLAISYIHIYTAVKIISGYIGFFVLVNNPQLIYHRYFQLTTI